MESVEERGAIAASLIMPTGGTTHGKITTNFCLENWWKSRVARTPSRIMTSKRVVCLFCLHICGVIIWHRFWRWIVADWYKFLPSSLLIIEGDDKLYVRLARTHPIHS